MAASITDLLCEPTTTSRPDAGALTAQKLEGAASITVDTTAGWPTATAVHFVIYQVTAAGVRVEGTQTEWKGIVTSSTAIGTLTLQAGTDQVYPIGSKVICTPTAAWGDDLVEGILTHADQDGTLKAGAVDNAAVITDSIITPAKFTTALQGDWKANLLPAVSSVTENGNRSADITFASTVANILTPGMRIRTSRTVAAPTYMGGLFNGTNQYFTKVTCTSTLSTVTDNFTITAHILPTTYPAARAYICGRSDATPNNGFGIFIEPSGQIGVIVFNAATANLRSVLSYQSISVLKRQHIAVTWAAGVVTMYLDGASIPVTTATTGGTAPTTAGTGGDWSIGRFGAFGAYSSGYISGVGVFNAVLSASTIRSYKNQVLSGSETNCIGAWSLNNTGVNQQAAGTNDLSAVNSVSYSAGTSPYCTDANGAAAGTYDWAIVTRTSPSTPTVATVQYPEGCAIPTSGGISTVDYSGVKAPFGMPVAEDKWTIAALYKASGVQSSPVSGTWYNMSSSQLNIPIGNWAVDYATILYVAKGGTAGTAFATLSTTSSTESDAEFSSGSFHALTGDNAYFQNRQKTVSPTSATPYYLNAMFNTTGATTLQFYIGVPYQIRAKLAYL